jgi:hypothetical protein
MTHEFFKLPDGKIVCFNPEGRWHGWIFRVGRDGGLISERQLASYAPMHDPAFDRAYSGKGD